MFVFVMGGAALPDTDGSSGCQDQQEGSVTAARRPDPLLGGKVGLWVVCQEVVAVVRALRSCPARLL